MFKPKLPQQEQGFTLIMVLAAILIALLSVTFAMQMLAIAALFKARAQGYAEATTWIQADLENVKAQAANFQDTSLTVAASSTDTVLHVASVDGFQDGDTLIVGTNSTNSIKIKTGGVDFMGKTITLNTSLGGSNTWPIGTTVLATTRCKSSVLMSDATLGT
ncbi:MAG: hypothetical protein JO235_18225, partial [Chroococcidiopsidaceae cyanobacterium CP_BM_RX_35]|nr:hypothetical protein [Chroococcidiopsidaceae cyanobacterium CP_BM_RX_35]